MIRTVFAMAVAALGFCGRFRDFASRADCAAAVGVCLPIPASDEGAVVLASSLLAWTVWPPALLVMIRDRYDMRELRRADHHRRGVFISWSVKPAKFAIAPAIAARA